MELKTKAKGELGCKGANPQAYMLYESILVTFLKGQNYRNGEQMGGCQGLRKGSGERQVGAAIKATWGLPVVMAMFSILVASMSIALLSHCPTAS